ncbi:MAG: hypothetical protein H7061_00640 [Bdellovibrionaceae bacterium]|nr:hypothetical protein [Bdellovibrio sp.]
MQAELSQTPTVPLIPGLDLTAFMNFASNPSNTQSILDVQKGLLAAPNRAQMAQWIIKAIGDSDFQHLLNERYSPEFPTNAQLQACPENSLGRALVKHLTANNIQLDFAGLDLSMFYGKELSPIAYFGIRSLRIHDILHTVLGLGVTALDEYFIASFTLAQYHSAYHMLLISSGFMHMTFHDPENVPKFIEGIMRFYNLGLKAKFVTGYRFEDNFATPLAEIRRELNLHELLADKN